MRLRSIRVTLRTSIAAILALLALVSVSAVASLVKIDGQIETIDRKWLTGTQILGELNNTLSEFRVAEGYRALASNGPSALQAEFLADRSARSIAKLVGRLELLSQDAGISDDLRAFSDAWQTMLKQHRDWVAAAARDDTEKAVGYGSALQRQYEAVQLAAANLIDDAKGAAAGEADAADLWARRATFIVMVLAAAAAAIAVALMVRVELRINRPLGTITSALSRLAAGDRDTRVPELHRRDEIGAMAKAFEVFRANAVALAEAQERAEALARHDALTGLPNRRLFAGELEAALTRTADGCACAVMLIDLDRFKPVNDLHGHATGDLVLCEIAARIRGLVAEGTVARLGGDEFAVITPFASDRLAAADMAVGLASRIVSSVAEEVRVDEVRVCVGASIGISICPSSGFEAEDVLRTADLAMYRAKADGRGTFRFFEDSMDAELRAKADLEADVRQALEAGDIKPYYQPLVDLASNRIAGFEVLARWEHEERGFVPPGRFIPVVEQIGALGRLTEAMLAQAFGDARHWGADICVAVNISPGQFQDVGFPAMVAKILMSHDFPPQRLEIEVTESALVNNLRAAKFTLTALQQLGVRVVLDDFGTGYSSLAHLHEFKFNKIKIDRSFVLTMMENSDSETIVDAVLGLARNLGMPVVAEGIETQGVMDLLTSRGCAYGQGFLFSRAVPALAAGAMLADRQLLSATA